MAKEISNLQVETQRSSDFPQSAPSAISGWELLLEAQNVNGFAGKNTADKHLSPMSINLDEQPVTPRRTEPVQNEKPPAESEKPKNLETVNPSSVESSDVSHSRLFKRVDIDRNGFMSRDELLTASRDRSFNARDAKFVSELYRNVDSIQRLTNNEWGWENDGITPGDLAEHDRRRQSEQVAAYHSETWADARFQKFDKDRDSELSLAEVEAGLRSKNVDSLDVQMLTYLKNNFNKVLGADGERLFGRADLNRDDVRAQQTNGLSPQEALRVRRANW